nr:HAD-IA family hydrolase [Enterococcus sp. DIV1298c]
MIENYIWDFDGTLFDTYPAMVEGAFHALNDFGIERPKNEIYRVMKQESMRKLRESYQLEEVAFNQLFHEYERQYQGMSAPFKETEMVLRHLKESGAKHYILTHRVTASTWELLKNFDLADLVEEVIGIDQGFARKPAPDAILHLIDTYKMKLEKTMMVGDRKLDIEAGINANVSTCLYDIDHFLGEIPADHTVANLADILMIKKNTE